MTDLDPRWIELRGRLDPADRSTYDDLHVRYRELARGSTTRGGLPYPDPTDPIAEGADAIRALAETVTDFGSMRSMQRTTEDNFGQGAWINVAALTWPDAPAGLYLCITNIAISGLGGTHVGYAHVVGDNVPLTPDVRFDAINTQLTTVTLIAGRVLSSDAAPATLRWDALCYQTAGITTVYPFSTHMRVAYLGASQTNQGDAGPR